MATKSQHKESERTCPFCKQLRTFPDRSETCSDTCATALKKHRDKELREAKLELQVRALERDLTEVKEARAVDIVVEDFLSRVLRHEQATPDWVSARPHNGKRRAIPTALMSDWHLFEYVDPKQIGGVNGFGREIAEKRIKNFFTNTCRIARDYWHGFSYAGIVLAGGGDIVSGSIHEELAQTNELSMMETALTAKRLIAHGIRQFADEFGKVFVPWVVGNHGRNTKKPINKGRVRDNFDWLIGCLVADELKNDKRVTFWISDSSDITYSVYGTRYCLTHGDQFKGGTGISGVMSPMMLGDARKRKRAQATQLPYDFLVTGHFHQLMWMRRIICNGALKGYDEYAYHCNFEFEPPQQALWLTDPEHGLTLTAPIHVQDSSEPWIPARPMVQGFPIQRISTMQGTRAA